LKNIIERDAYIDINDIGIIVGINSILFYTITVLCQINDNTLYYSFFVDLISMAMCLGVYIKYIEELNKNKEVEKGSELVVQRNLILFMCLCPYYVVF
tara:strand:- start:1060 stop:1353 length:294 start_codon:yes stop_codon:yes gene_type:complete